MQCTGRVRRLITQLAGFDDAGAVHDALVARNYNLFTAPRRLHRKLDFFRLGLSDEAAIPQEPLEYPLLAQTACCIVL